jgi:hypothetical protein
MHLCKKLLFPNASSEYHKMVTLILVVNQSSERLKIQMPEGFAVGN